MRKTLSFVLVVAALGCGVNAANAFGLSLKNPLASQPASGNTDADVSSFVTKAELANALVTDSAFYMAVGLASKERAAELQAKKKALDGVADPKEKNAKMEELQKDSIATIQQESAKKETTDQLKKASSTKKKAFSLAFFNFALGALQAKDLIPLGNGIVQNVASNPLNAAKALPVKDSIGTLTSLTKASGDVLSKLPDVLRAADIKVEMPKAADEKPKEVTDPNAFN